MEINIDELKKISVTEDEVLFIKVSPETTVEAALSLRGALHALRPDNPMKAIIHTDALDIKQMTKEGAKSLLEELKKTIGE